MVFEIAVSPCGALVNRRAVKTSAARRVPVAAQCALRIDRWRGGIRAKPVLAPLPDVAEHVVEAKGVRRFAARLHATFPKRCRGTRRSPPEGGTFAPGFLPWPRIPTRPWSATG